MRMSKVQRPVEYKDIVSTLTASDQPGVVTGYLSTFSNIDAQDDRVCPGAFAVTIKDGYARKASQGLDYLWPLLWSHDWQSSPPLGGIFFAAEDRTGLLVKAKLNLSTRQGQEMYEALRQGFISKFSMGYKTIRYDYERIENKQVRNLRECAIMEASLVTFPANDEAQVVAVKNQGGSSMFARTKDFTSNYQSAQASDWVDDFGDLANALQQSILELFAPGRSPLDDFESDVLPGLLDALRAYISEGVSLGYTGGPASAQGVYAAMSMSGDIDTKRGYLNAETHVGLITAVDNIMKHAKVAKSALSSLGSGSPARRFNALAGQPIYGQASSSDYFEEKEAERESAEDVKALLKTITTGLTVSNALREGKETLASSLESTSVSADVDRALAAFLNKQR